MFRFESDAFEILIPSRNGFARVLKFQIFPSIFRLLLRFLVVEMSFLPQLLGFNEDLHNY